MKKALVVDDDLAVSSLVSLYLEELGFEPFTAQGGKKGLEKYFEDQRKWDVIFVDLCMPDIHGLEVVKEIRLHNKNVNIIIVTGYTSETHIELDEKSCLLYKPYNIYTLEKILNKMFSKNLN